MPSFISAIAFISHHVFLIEMLLSYSHECSKMNDTYGIHYWSILWSSYRKLAWVGSEPRPLNSVLTDWAIRPWVQLALRTNFVQLLQFHLFVQCSRFISVFAFISRHIGFKRSLAQVITLVAEWIDKYGIHHWRSF